MLPLVVLHFLVSLTDPLIPKLVRARPNSLQVAPCGERSVVAPLFHCEDPRFDGSIIDGGGRTEESASAWVTQRIDLTV